MLWANRKRIREVLGEDSFLLQQEWYTSQRGFWLKVPSPLWDEFFAY